jgi:hypothetical protein
MKSASVKQTVLALACLLAATITTAQAEEPREFFSQTPTNKGDGVQFAQKGDDIKANKPEDNIPYHVRCWQNGVLIVDEANWRNPQLQSRFVAMKPMGGSEPGLYLVDFFNTFCEIKKR